MALPRPQGGLLHHTVVVDLVRPVSETGEVTLNSADPLEQPNINLNFFSNDLDVIAMREGIRWTYDLILKGDGFKDIVVDEYPWAMPRVLLAKPMLYIIPNDRRV